MDMCMCAYMCIYMHVYLCAGSAVKVCFRTGKTMFFHHGPEKAPNKLVECTLNDLKGYENTYSLDTLSVRYQDA